MAVEGIRFMNLNILCNFDLNAIFTNFPFNFVFHVHISHEFSDVPSVQSLPHKFDN